MLDDLAGKRTGERIQVKLAEALAVGDVAVLAGTDMDADLDGGRPRDDCCPGR